MPVAVATQPEDFPSASPPAVSPAWKDVVLLLLLAGITWLWRLGACGIFDLDEGLYVAAAREMLLSGDWITPRVNGVLFYDKPPVGYWAVATCFRLFGQNEFAARLPSALAAAGLTLVVYSFGRRVFGRLAGLLAAVMLVLSPLVGMVARQMMLDAQLSLCVAIALVGWFMGETSTATNSRRWSLLLWAAAGLGLMTKGLPGIVLPAATIVVMLLIEERFRPLPVLRRLGALNWSWGLPLFLLIVVPWHVLVWKASPLTVDGKNMFLQEYVVHHHLQRFQGKDFGHNLPIWFFVPVLLAGFFPWSAYLPWALTSKGDVGEGAEAPRARLLLRVWIGVTFTLFSAGVSKCEVYILPLFAAAALLTGEWCARALREPWSARALRVSTAGIACAAAVGLTALLAFTPALQREGLPTELTQCGVRILGAVILAGGLAALLQARGMPLASMRVLIAGTAVAGAVAISDGLGSLQQTILGPVQSLTGTGARLAQAEGAALAIEANSPRRPSVLFYLPAPVAYHSPIPVLEGRMEQGAQVTTPLLEFRTRHERAYVVIDDVRGRQLAEKLAVERVAGGRGWVLLRHAPPGEGVVRQSRQ